MKTSLQEVAPLAHSLGRAWQPFADSLAAALATLSEDQSNSPTGTVIAPGFAARQHLI